MKKEFIANTVEEAKALAVAEFNKDASKITFNVIEEEKKGFLGIGKTNARIVAEYEPSKTEIAADYIRKILECMNIDAKLNITENEDSAVIDIEGDTTGAVIGRRGETLDAIQYLAGMAANRNDKEYFRITLDSCGYRERRKAALEELARKISKSVIRTGRTTTLEPMNPYERRIIHATVSEIDGVTSKSVGDEPYRKVVISSANSRPYRKNDRQYQDGRGNKPIRRRESQSMELMKTSFEKEYKKPKPEDDMVGSELYGKIDL